MEGCIGLHEFETPSTTDCVDVVHPDASRDGYRHLNQVSARAGSRGVPLCLHVWGGVMTLVSNAHYAAAVPNCKILEYCRLDNELRENFLPDGFEQDGDHVQLPDTDGLGLNRSDDIDKRYPY